MRECTQCGNYIPGDVSICPHCGIIGSATPRLLFGITLFIVGGLTTYAFCGQQEIGILQKIVVVGIMVMVAGIFGIFSIIRAVKAIGTVRRIKKYRAHTNHDFTDSCYCKICGKLNSHDWDDHCKCNRCGKERHVWKNAGSCCKCSECGEETAHNWSGDGCKKECLHCDATMIEHDWQSISCFNDPDPAACGGGYVEIRCSKCGEVKSREIF